MGGDLGPHLIIQASLDCLKELNAINIILVGPAVLIEKVIRQYPHSIDHNRLEIQPASETIGLTEPLSKILRNKPNASMRIALELVQKKIADACISAGNSGALMALSRMLLKTVPGVERPAMITSIPTNEGCCQLLDLGANVDCSAEQLYQFAVMGSLSAEAQGIKTPRIALLNIGTESTKGNQLVKLTATLLEQSSNLNYIGFIEANGLYQGNADVVVCDGFVGNVFIKSSEALAKILDSKINYFVNRNIFTRFFGGFIFPGLTTYKNKLSPCYYNGANLIGLQGIVVKSHGAAGRESFRSAIYKTQREIQMCLPLCLSERIEDFL
ncbi:UNVERIFIED_CONTAM: hypothetical protein GTU68_066245 [Idotea baltica]|nr:hypothetical protein [Idotea baltica]